MNGKHPYMVVLGDLAEMLDPIKMAALEKALKDIPSLLVIDSLSFPITIEVKDLLKLKLQPKPQLKYHERFNTGRVPNHRKKRR